MLLDTNIYRAILDNDSRVVEHLKTVTAVDFPLAVVAELYKGFYGGNRQDDNIRQLHDFIAAADMVIPPPTVQTAKNYAELAVFCRRRGRALSDNDMWIAATALEHNEPLLTLDQDFEVFADYPDLAVIVI